MRLSQPHDTQITSHHSAGFSMLELIISIAIASIVTTTALPSMMDLITKNRIINQTNLLIQSLFMARSFAIAQNKKVYLCQLNASQAIECANNKKANRRWTNGWLIYADNNGNQDYDKDDNLIHIHKTHKKVNIVFNQKGSLRFFPNGSSRSSGFYLCDSEQRYFRHIYLLYSGRPRFNEKLNERQKLICKNS